MNADGSNQKQLTTTEDQSPTVSPDGAWVVFHSWRSGKPMLWKVPIEGGDSVQVSDRSARLPVFSNDGKSLACTVYDDSVSPPQYRSAIISFPEGQLVRIMDLPATAQNLTWSPDGKNFFHVDTRADVANVWTMPVTGGTPKQVTKFTSEFIDNYSVSGDGKHFLLSRSWGNNDIILIKNFR